MKKRIRRVTKRERAKMSETGYLKRVVRGTSKGKGEKSEVSEQL